VNPHVAQALSPLLGWCDGLRIDDPIVIQSRSLSGRDVTISREITMPITIVEIQELEVSYWYEVDHNLGRAAAVHYLEDGTFVIGDTVFRGRDEIAGFYRRREERGPRTARHVMANSRVGHADNDVTTLEYIMLLYAADGGGHVLEAHAPVLIADVTTEYVRVAGAWRVRARALRPIFEGGIGAIKT